MIATTLFSGIGSPFPAKAVPASSAGAPCEATGLAHLYSHLTVRAYGWHRHSSGCKKPPAKKFRKHTCLHNIDTGMCSCKCNYKPEEAV